MTKSAKSDEISRSGRAISGGATKKCWRSRWPRQELNPKEAQWLGGVKRGLEGQNLRKVA